MIGVEEVLAEQLKVTSQAGSSVYRDTMQGQFTALSYINWDQGQGLRNQAEVKWWCDREPMAEGRQKLCLCHAGVQEEERARKSRLELIWLSALMAATGPNFSGLKKPGQKNKGGLAEQRHC